MENINENILESSIFKDDIEIKILDANESFLTNANSSRIQFHPFIYFYFIAEGSGTFFIESESIKIKKDDLIIINSNIGHNIYVDEDQYTVRTLGFGLESIALTSVKPYGEENEDTSDLDDEILYDEDYESKEVEIEEIEIEEEVENDEVVNEEIDYEEDKDENVEDEKEEVEIDNFFHIHTEAKSKKIYELFSLIVDEFQSDRLYAKTLADALASSFLIDFLRDYEEEIEVVHDIDINRQVDYIKGYIDNNYQEDMKLEDLSNMAYMNKFHLIAEFKQAYRVTPIEYLILKRIEISKGLLISTNHSMETIADIVGFNSQSYFNQVFRKKVGLTPSQFRRKHRL